ncbi:MAG: phospholipase A [Sulfuricella sp.]|nr:phospholipase A [Sulfuricella sp.]
MNRALARRDATPTFYGYVLDSRGLAASHGSALAEISWALRHNTRFYLQAFRGYGESMLDYNHQQTSLGAG